MKSFKNKTRIYIVLTMGLVGVVLSSKAQGLEVLIKEALANNPEIKMFDLKHQRALVKTHESKSLSNTEFGVGFFVSPPETRTGAQEIKVSAKQMFSWFGMFTARENYAKALAEATYEDIAIAKRKLVASVAQSYYKLYALKEKQSILDNHRVLLSHFEEIALTSVEVGEASAIDVLRLQMQQNKLEQAKQVLGQEYLEEQSLLNKLLNRDKNITISIDIKLTMPSEDLLKHTDNLSLHPELLKYDKLYKSIEKSEILNKKTAKPKFGFGLDYITVSKRPNMTFNDNGKDIVMPMASISLPIFNTISKSKTKQNALLQQEINFQKQDKLNRLEALLDGAIKKSNAAKISYNTQTKNLKLAKDSENMIVKSYETANTDFNTVLDILKLQLQFQINQIESIKNYYLQNVTINYLTKGKAPTTN